MVGATGSNQTAKARSTATALSFNASTNTLSTSTINALGGVVNTDSGIRIMNPGGGSYTTTSAGVFGALKIRLPAAALGSSTMMSFKVQVYQYAVGFIQEFIISGYNYLDASYTWYSESALCVTDSSSNLFTVRFGKDSVSQCVYIGEIGFGWAYPQVFVTEFIGGYTNATQAIWATGWNISFENSAFQGVTRTRTAVKTWNANTDGSGSGLDADTVDGIQGSTLKGLSVMSWLS